MNLVKYLSCVCLLLELVLCPFRDASAGTVIGTAWPATDAVGRSLPTPDEVGPPQKDRFVGIFYFLWLNERHNSSPHWQGPYDVSRILEKDPEAMKKPDSPLWGPIGTSHYWGEPLFGYYLARDPWVLRRHAQMLADAGIDTLIFDTTNAVTYRDVYMELCRVFQEVRRDGGATPRISFMVNTEAGKTAERIFEELYKPGLYPDLWFRWQGKPLMICDPEQAGPELREFFTLRRAHWPFEQINTPYAWHWEAIYPQVYGYTDDPKRAEQVNVAVAQNLRVSDGKVTNMSNGDARGRSFHNGKMDASPNAVNHGYNFGEQWKRALELKPPFVMVTGWNEWIAGRWGKPDGPLTFVDQLDQQFSRDIEPMKGGHGDNYYWQLVANVRRYKGMPSPEAATKPISMHIGKDFEAWRDVGPEYPDHVGDTLPRDFDGADGLHYVNRTGRNDLVSCRVARDASHVYFYARTREALSPNTDPNWMWLLLDLDRDAKTGWEGYDFIVNRQIEDGKTAWLEKHRGGWTWDKVMKFGFQEKGHELALSIPRTALGLREGSTAVSLNFKWVDNTQRPGDIMDFWLSGDVAPEGRFAYTYLAD